MVREVPRRDGTLRGECHGRQFFHTFPSSFLPSPTECEPFPGELGSPLCPLWVELLAVCIWLFSLLWNILLLFPYKNEALVAPLVGLWLCLLLRPPRSKNVQDLFEKSWFLVFFCLLSLPSFSFRNSVKLCPAVSLNHCSLKVDCVPQTRYSFSPLLSS